MSLWNTALAGETVSTNVANGELSYPATWYAATADASSARRALGARIAADVCVIGGGLAGLSVACELALLNTSVVLLEARRLASGASGLNGGFVSSGFAAGLPELSRKLGLPAAQELHRLSMEGTEIVRNRAKKFPAGIVMGEGLLLALRYRDPDGCQRYGAELGEKFGRKVSYLSTEAVRAKLKSEVYFHGLLDAEAFHIHPLRYALALARLAEEAGARLHEGSRVVEVSVAGAELAVRTASGQVRARHVVYCNSAHDRHLFRSLGRAVLPVATYIAVSEPMGDRVRTAIDTGAAVADNRRAGDYYRTIDGGRILWGGRITTRISEPARLAEMMKSDMLEVFPQVGDPQMSYAWSGLMGYARHKMPLIGELAPRQWVAAAFGGHGLNTTAMAGQLLARAIVDGDAEWRRFQRLGAPWIGGPFGRAGVQLSYWKMQLKDRYEETRPRA